MIHASNSSITIVPDDWSTESGSLICLTCLCVKLREYNVIHHMSYCSCIEYVHYILTCSVLVFQHTINLPQNFYWSVYEPEGIPERKGIPAYYVIAMCAHDHRQNGVCTTLGSTWLCRGSYSENRQLICARSSPYIPAFEHSGTCPLR